MLRNVLPDPTKSDDDKDLMSTYDMWSKAKTPQYLYKVVDKLKPTINSAINTYGTGDSPIIRGRAKVLAAKAIQSYDRNNKASLRSHVMLQLQPLMRYSNQSTQPLKMSERKLMQLKFLNEAERNFYDKYGREPSDIELADTLGWSRKAIGKVRAYSRPIVGAYNDIDNEDSSDPAVGGQDRSKMWMEYVYHDADPTDKKIMEWKFGLGGRPVKSNNEIASALRISSSAVTQRATKLQNKLLQGMALKYG